MCEFMATPLSGARRGNPPHADAKRRGAFSLNTFFGASKESINISFLAVAFDKVCQPALMARCHCGELHTHAGRGHAVGGARPYNTGMRAYGRGIVGQAEIKGKYSFHRQRRDGLNKGARDAQIGYA